MKNIFDFVLRFCTTFWLFRKNGLIRKIRLTSKLITSQPALQTFAIDILSNISQSKGNQTMKFGQLIEHNKRNIFLQKLYWKWGKKTNSRPLIIFQKNLIWTESKWSAAYFQYISLALNLPYNKNNFRLLIQRYAQFLFFRKGSGIHLLYDFSRKMFLILYSNDQNSLSNCLYFSKHLAICVLK